MKHNAFKPAPLDSFIFKYFFIFISLFIITSCRKEAVSNTPSHDNLPLVSSTTLRSSVLDQQIVDEIQWIINNIIPIVSEEQVQQEILSGDRYSSLVTLKLNDLGFSGFDDFAEEFQERTSAVSSAINAGQITTILMHQVLLENMANLDFSAMSGNPSYLPCYEELVNTLIFVVVAVALASETVIGAVAAAVAGTAVAYLQYKNCLHENYPNGG